MTRKEIFAKLRKIRRRARASPDNAIADLPKRRPKGVSSAHLAYLEEKGLLSHWLVAADVWVKMYRVNEEGVDTFRRQRRRRNG